MIEIKTPGEIDTMRAAGKIVKQVLTALCNNAVAGKNTAELDIMAEEMIRAAKSRPAFKGYNGYPSTICSSVNNSIVHEIPSRNKVLKDGDIISFDVGAELDGYFADAAMTVGVGEISPKASKLVEVTRKSLEDAITMAVEDNRISDISSAVQKRVESGGFSVVRYFVGHGIGRRLHEPPEIPNFGPPGRGPRLKAGMVLAIEPMVNEGSWEVKILEDGWTAITRDGSLSAHFEHTVVVGKEKAEILT